MRSGCGERGGGGRGDSGDDWGGEQSWAVEGTAAIIYPHTVGYTHETSTVCLRKGVIWIGK